MTDEELLFHYDKATSKCTAMIRAMYREGTDLKTIVDRLNRLDRRPNRSLHFVFGTAKPEVIPDLAIRNYARTHKIRTDGRERAAIGVVSEWCAGCEYLLKDYGGICDYLSITGKRRGCPAGDGCTKRRRRKTNEAE